MTKEKQMTLNEFIELAALIGFMPVHLGVTFWVLAKVTA